jgi:hypothetical protein
MKEIKLLLNTDSFEDSNEGTLFPFPFTYSLTVHCLANLVKRWYGELPKKLISSLSSDAIQKASNGNTPTLSTSPPISFHPSLLYPLHTNPHLFLCFIEN